LNEDGRSLGPAQTIGRGVRTVPALVNGLPATVGFALAGTGARIAVPILVQQTIDRGLTGGVDVGLIAWMCAVGAVAIVVSSICLRAAALRLGVQAERGLFEVRLRLFRHIHRLSLEQHGETRRGALVSRVTSDVETLTQFFSWGGLTLLLDGTQVIVVSAVMLAYDWRLAVVAFAVSAPLIAVLRGVQRRLLRAHQRARETTAETLGVVGELLQGADTLRIYGATGRYRNTAHRVLHERARANVRAGVIGALLFPSGEVFAVFTVAAVTATGVALGAGGGLTAGALVGFMFLTYRFLEPIAEFTEIMDQTQSAVASLGRVLGVLDTPAEPPPPQSPIILPRGPLGIDFEDVNFAYASSSDGDDASPVLRGLSLSIRPGQHVALVGPSGSGKTTVARLIARFADPVAGTVRLGGVDLRRVDNSSLRSRLAVVPQEPFLFSGSIRHNLEFAVPGVDDSALRTAVADLGLEDWLAALPNGLNTEVGERGGQLSAGERQLVALVRAALTNPDVLVLDEATSSVDAPTEVRIAEALARLEAGRTTISIAHRMSTAARAERVVVLVDGRVAGDGSHENLLSRPGAYADLHRAWSENNSAR
jgi:putative ABC transport system ATP-binding protein